MSLYRAETRRLTKRRFTRFFVLGLMLALLAIAAGTFLTNEKASPQTVATAQAEADAQFQRAQQQAERDAAECQAAQGTAAADRWPPNCEGLFAPTAEEFQAEWYMPATFVFREQFPDMITTLAALLAVVAFVIGASFVGAEWSSGGMMNLLLWRPRRAQVLGAKLAAFLVAVLAFTVVLSALWTGLFVLVAELRGSTETMTSGAWQSIGLMELRALAVVVVAAVVGFGLASVGRHTAVALGAVVALVVVFQFGLGTVLSLADVKFADAYLLPFWAIAWMNKELVVEDASSCDFNSVSGCQPETFTMTWQMAGGGLAAIFLVTVVAALGAIRSRDIT